MIRLLKYEDVNDFLKRAKEEAQKSPCLRSKCGCVIIKNGELIGKGFNSPPGNKKLTECRKDSLPKDFKSDKTCCIHAEQRAIMDALAKNPDRIKESILYFVRLDDKGEITPSGDPYCTICSKMALDIGINEFVLVQKDAIRAFETNHYNELSFSYKANK